MGRGYQFCAARLSGKGNRKDGSQNFNNNLNLLASKKSKGSKQVLRFFCYIHLFKQLLWVIWARGRKSNRLSFHKALRRDLSPSARKRLGKRPTCSHGAAGKPKGDGSFALEDGQAGQDGHEPDQQMRHGQLWSPMTSHAQSWSLMASNIMPCSPMGSCLF